MPISIEGPLECYIWGGACTPRGYPVMKVNGKIKLVRRVVYEAEKRPLQPGERVYTDCGQRKCVKSDHLVAR